jgi:predicted metal-binding membrane protein
MIRLLQASRVPSAWRMRAWRHPEWWSLGLAALAWAAIVAGAASVHGSDAHGHAAHAGMAAGTGFPWLREAGAWLLMVAAMMVPLVAGPVVTTAERSRWGRRDRAVAGFLAGYLGLWLAAGLLVLGGVAMTGADRWWRSPWAVAGGFALAAAWQVTPLKRRALRSCHRTVPLAPDGWRADLACVGYGGRIGRSCLASCWAPMLACLLAGHAVWAMAAVGAIGFAERARPRPNPWAHALVFLALALVAGIALVRQDM